MLARCALLDAGHTEVPEGDADLHVINTCCITSEAESKSRQSVRRSLRTAGEVHVAGCAVNLNPRQFEQIDVRVRAFVGTADDVAAAIGGWVGADQGLGCADTEHDVLVRRCTRRPAGPDRRTGQPSGPDGRTRGFVKVQDGCDCHCAYCIIPTVRGAARSRPVGAVLQEVRRRVAGGQPEMVMTGISVGDYRDPERGLELGELMVEVARVPGVERVRLSSVEVIHVKDSLLAAIACEAKICPHLHVPLQSGDDRVLAAMGRHYTVGEYLRQIDALRQAAPQVNVTTDVIVGFPTEDEAAFQRTLEAVDAAGITRVHVFPYSPRPGTAAAQLGDRVPAEEKKRRSHALRARSDVRSRHHRHAKLGGPERVLVDKVADSRCAGYSGDYTRCYLPAGAAGRGGLVEVTCVELEADGISCSVTGAPGAILIEEMTVTEQVHTDMTTAMKAGEKDRVGALRLVLSELQKAAKEGGADELGVLRRERKRRLEAATQFRDGGRPELADQEESEARLIEGYLPAELDDSELDAIVASAIAETGASSQREMGAVMKVVMAKSGARADGKRASARVREALS